MDFSTEMHDKTIFCSCPCLTFILKLVNLFVLRCIFFPSKAFSMMYKMMHFVAKRFVTPTTVLNA